MFRESATVDDLDVTLYRGDIDRIVAAYIDAKVEIVADIAAWCAEHSGGAYAASDLDNPVGKALWHSPTEPDRVLLRSQIPACLIEDHLLSLYFRGFERVYEVLTDSRTFLIHLVLHEVAHIKHDWRQGLEAKCDDWAFSNVASWLET